MSEPPSGYVRLYYYTGKQWGMKVLWEKRLKIARYQDLNDPFELIPFNRTRKASRRFYDGKVKKLFNGKYGIICFSESWQTTLMWSHYGEKHTGMCLGFDVLAANAEKVRYAETLLDDPYDPAHHIKGMSARVFSDAMLCKYAGWRYEREQRVHAPLEEMIDGIYYKNFDDSIQLREVILGPRCTLQPSEVVASITNPPQDVDIYATGRVRPVRGLLAGTGIDAHDQGVARAGQEPARRVRRSGGSGRGASGRSERTRGRRLIALVDGRPSARNV